MLRSIDGPIIADGRSRPRCRIIRASTTTCTSRRDGCSTATPSPATSATSTVALESMGYTTSGAEALGFDSVFDLATSVFELTYLYYVPQVHEVPERMGAWRQFADDYLAGSWYGVPWIMSVVVLFFGRVALWSSLDSTPQSEAMVSMAFFLAAVLAGGCSQMIGRKGTFYLLQKNYPLVRWTVSRFMIYSGSAGRPGHRPRRTPSTSCPTTGCTSASCSPNSPRPSSSSCSARPRSTCSAASTRWPWPPGWPWW